MLCLLSWRQNRGRKKRRARDSCVTKCTDIFETKASARVRRVGYYALGGVLSGMERNRLFTYGKVVNLRDYEIAFSY